MDASIALSLFALVWLLIYMTSKDIMKLLSKHLIYLTLITALFEAGALYGILFYILMAFTIVLWAITLLLDYMDAFIKPAKKMVEITTPRGR